MNRKQDIIINQIGRSLLEMVAILSITCLITLGFITAYQYAWDRHRSNLIFSELSAMALSASSQMITQKDFTLQEFITEGKDKPYIYEIYPVSVGKKYKGAETDFSLTVENVPKRICEFLVHANWKFPFEIVVNEEGICEERELGNMILFAFHEKLSKSGASSSEPIDEPKECVGCQSWQSCSSGNCVCDAGKLENLRFSECQAAGFNCSCLTGNDDTSCQNIQGRECIAGQPSYQYGNL